ncbi:MAG: ubiquinone/menaquinone biosynthesis methyltransferase [Leptospira sp.]|nr:ubiquinone/menaquinone biosynthesis methyltransferase [Leptospira sp.]
MPNFEMPDTAQKAEFVKTNFDTIAKKYDLFNDLNSFFLHRHWKNYLTNVIRKRSRQHLVCLDLCCGTGDISVRISSLPEVDKLVAVDFSENMLNIAAGRLRNSVKSSAEIGDATNLRNFPDNHFDVITVGFGLRNVNNLEKALQEIFRILKPGGIFMNLDVGKVRNSFIKIFADFYFFKIVPVIGYVLWGGKNDMFDYLPVSSLYYPDQETLKTLLEKTGFTSVSYKNFVFGNVALHSGEKT